MNKINTKIILLMAFAASTLKIKAQEGTVNIDQPEAINRLLEFKKDSETIDSFKIQVYSGASAYRAETVMNEFKSMYSNWPVSMEFNTPNYKIWVGNFINRLEADRALMKIKTNYMNAFIFKPKKKKS